LALSARQPGAEITSGKARGDAIAPSLPGRFALRSERTVTWAKLEALQVPTLLITGDADLYTPPSVLRMFAKRMSFAEWAVIPETGHSSYWENPEVFNAAVVAFLDRH
jgi:pimeloyl-ACP methyl ester carboxylesterase